MIKHSFLTMFLENVKALFLIFFLILIIVLCFYLITYYQAIRKYYISGKYENDVEKICKKAEEYFNSLTVRDNSLVIFDVDDTALYNNQWRRLLYIPTSKTLAILPVLELYEMLIKKGFKIIFITARSVYSCDYKNIKKDLINAGYTQFTNLICMSNRYAFDPSTKSEIWKADMRKILAEKYNIAGIVGDRDKDFITGYEGYIVKLPNLIY